MLARNFGNRPKVAATLLVFVLMALVIFPLSFVPAAIESAADGISRITNNWTELKLPPPPAWVGDLPLFGRRLAERWTAVSDSEELLRGVKPFLGPAFQWLAAQGASLGLAILEILVAIILVGVFLTTETGLTSTFHKIANRLGGESAEHLLEVAVRDRAQRCTGSDRDCNNSGLPIRDRIPHCGGSVCDCTRRAELWHCDASNWYLASVDTSSHMAVLSGRNRLGAIHLLARHHHQCARQLDQTTLDRAWRRYPDLGHLYRCDWRHIDDRVYRHLHRPTDHGGRLLDSHGLAERGRWSCTNPEH